MRTHANTVLAEKCPFEQIGRQSAQSLFARCPFVTPSRCRPIGLRTAPSPSGRVSDALQEAPLRNDRSLSARSARKNALTTAAKAPLLTIVHATYVYAAFIMFPRRLIY